MSLEKSARNTDSPSVAVSVVIPAYNAAPFIAQTIESVFGQTFRNFEVIVVNDGSPDTAELERELQPYMDRIRYRTQPNAGPSSARNLGIREARGEFVAFLDSDDAWLPDYLATQMKILTADPSIDLLYLERRSYRRRAVCRTRSDEHGAVTRCNHVRACGLCRMHRPHILRRRPAADGDRRRRLRRAIPAVRGFPSVVAPVFSRSANRVSPRCAGAASPAGRKSVP